MHVKNKFVLPMWYPSLNMYRCLLGSVLDSRSQQQCQYVRNPDQRLFLPEPYQGIILTP